MELENIFAAIRARYPVGESSLAELARSLSPCRFPRRHLLVEKGRFARCAYFIGRGMTRSYWLVDGEEVTTSFSCEGAIVFSMDELYYNKVSEEFVETVEEVSAYRIAIADLERLFRTNLELANWGRVIHQDEYRRLHRSHKERLTLPARERLEAFVRQFPEVYRRAQLGHVASYLGITLPTLSRLRAQAVR